MTDLLDEVTSDEEVIPQAPPEAVPVVTCRYCSEVFEGAPRLIRRGLHEKKAHPDEWAKAKAGGPKPKPKKAPAKKATPKAPTKPSAPKPRRTSTASALSAVLSNAAPLVGRVDPPLSRALMFSAPATGAAIDELLAGTFVDRMALQPLAKGADKWDRLGGVIAFPVLVAVVSRRPQMFEPLQGYLRDSLTDVLVQSIPAMKQKQARERKAVEALSSLREVDERYAQAEDPIGVLLMDIFGVGQEQGGQAE